MVAFHVVFHSFEQEIMWFGQLTACLPGILVTLDKAIGGKHYKVKSMCNYSIYNLCFLTKLIEKLIHCTYIHYRILGIFRLIKTFIQKNFDHFYFRTRVVHSMGTPIVNKISMIFIFAHVVRIRKLK